MLYEVITSAEIRVNGALVNERPPRLAVERGNAPIAVSVTAQGFEPSELRVIPDRDQAVVIPLLKRPEPVALPPQWDAGDAAPAEAGPEAGRAVSTPENPASSNERRPPRREPPPGSIITEYPE